MRATSSAPSRTSRHPADDEPATMERRVRRSEAPLTRRIPRVDPHLLALARGDVETLAPPAPDAVDAYDDADPTTVRYPAEHPSPAMLGHLELVDDEPEDPFGGLIPVEDEPENMLDDADILEVLDPELRDLELAVIDARKPR